VMIHRGHHAPARFRSEYLGHFWRVRVGQFWRAPKGQALSVPFCVTSSPAMSTGLPVCLASEVVIEVRLKDSPLTANAVCF
jgi:hypothetical protein